MRSLSFAGVLLIGLAVASPALALRDDPAPPAGPASGPGTDYRYSGKSFSLTMSRTPPAPPAAAAEDGKDGAPQQPGVLGWILRTLLGRD